MNATTTIAQHYGEDHDRLEGLLPMIDQVPGAEEPTQILAQMSKST